MPRNPCRVTQWSCVALTAFGLLPWSLTAGALVYRAIDSTVPLAMSFAAWLAMLVPLWVAWFAIVAWEKRHETAMPAVVMVLPVMVCVGLFLILPAGAAAN